MTLTAEVQKFEGFIKTLELKFFKGKLHQKIVAPHPEQTPSHAWVAIDSHDDEAPAPGEPIAAAEPEAPIDPPVDPPAAGGVQGDRLEEVRYDDSGAIPPAAAVAAAKPAPAAKAKA